MPYCSKCGYEVKDGESFCENCGTTIRINSNSKVVKRETVFEGSIHKCPNCGEKVNSFMTRCNSCGFEFRDSESSDAVKAFADKIDQLQSKKEAKSGVISNFFGVKNKKIEEQIINTIRNFSVPNTKEDIFEFMILASSNINTSVISSEDYTEAGANSEEEFNALKARNEAWRAKMQQVYQKAKITIGTESDFSKIQDIYLSSSQSINKAEKKRMIKSSRVLIFALCMMFLPILIFYGGESFFHSMRERKLEQTVQEIQVDIENGDYDSALIKAHSLHMDDNWSSESEKHWDDQRKALIKLIEQKMKEDKK